MDLREEKYKALQEKRNEAQRLMIAAKRNGNESKAIECQEEVKLLNKELRYLQKRLFYAKKAHFTP